MTVTLTPVLSEFWDQPEVVDARELPAHGGYAGLRNGAAR